MPSPATCFRPDGVRAGRSERAVICLCKQALAAHPLLKADLRLKLGIPIPPLLLDMAATAALPNMGLIAKADLAAVAALTLPPFPLSMSLAANVQAAVNAVAQLGLLGIPLTMPSIQASAELRGLMLSLAFHLPSLHIALPPLELQLIAKIAAAVSAIRLSLGIDLFVPGAFLQLQAALSAALKLQAGLPLDAALVANLAAYANFADTVGLIGGIGNLLPAIKFLLSLQLPGIRVDMGSASNFLLLLGMAASIKAAFGIDIAAPGALLALRARIKLLGDLLPLKLDLKAKLDLLLKLGMILPHLSILTHLSMSLKANLALLVGIPWPNVGPITLAASLGSQSHIALKVPCPMGCPVA